MKKESVMLVLGLTLLTLILAGCAEQPPEPVCNKPYILVGTSCCLDQDDNAICDSDEQEEIDIEEIIPELKETEIVEEETIEEVVEKRPTMSQEIVSEFRDTGCGDGICNTHETCKTCYLDCGCGSDGICLKEMNNTFTCYDTLPTSEGFRITLTNDVNLPVGSVSTAKAGEIVEIKLFAHNKQTSQLTCQYWVISDGITKKINDFSLSSFEVWYTAYTEVGSTFIVNGKGKDIDLRFVVQCNTYTKDIDDILFADHTIRFLPE